MSLSKKRKSNMDENYQQYVWRTSLTFAEYKNRVEDADAEARWNAEHIPNDNYYENICPIFGRDDY